MWELGVEGCFFVAVDEVDDGFILLEWEGGFEEYEMFLADGLILIDNCVHI